MICGLAKTARLLSPRVAGIQFVPSAVSRMGEYAGAMVALIPHTFITHAAPRSLGPIFDAVGQVETINTGAGSGKIKVDNPGASAGIAWHTVIA